MIVASFVEALVGMVSVREEAYVPCVCVCVVPSPKIWQIKYTKSVYMTR